MPGYDLSRELFKDQEALKRLLCPYCDKLLCDPVQPTCGHRLCRSCAEEIIAKDDPPMCPLSNCGEEFSDEDGAYVSLQMHTFLYYPINTFTLYDLI